MKNIYNFKTDGHLTDYPLLQDNSCDKVNVSFGDMKYSGTVRSCDSTMGCIFKWFIGGAAALGIIDFLTKTGVADKKHTDKMDEIKYTRDCKMEVLREANKLAKDKMDYAQKIYQERHAKVDDAKVEMSSDSPSDMNDDSSLHVAKTLNDIIAENPDTEFKPLVGDLITCGGINILYGPTGLGKSILAEQVGIETAEGKASCLVPNSEKCTPQNVKYLDSELDENDICSRYGKYGYYFPENLERSEVTFESPEKFIAFIENNVNQETSDSLYIIDNLLTICPALTGEKSKIFFRKLKEIQREARKRGVILTFIIVGHTTKDYTGGPIYLKNLSGPFNISAMATGIYGITSCSSDGKLIQLEVLKSRRKCDVGTKYILEKQEKPYIHFKCCDVVSAVEKSCVTTQDNTLVGQSNSYSATTSPVNGQQNDVINMVQMKDNGYSLRKIGKKFNISHTQVKRKIKEYNLSH
ncbi:MAG: AAA family ATPase [Bacteroidaceae bacterium]|nr:AAA family ATPase [Bacteroidaceae bacterium]